MELWDVYDVNRRRTGKKIVRGKGRLREGEYHLVVIILVFSSDGRLLIQKRNENKTGWPGMWDVSAGGAVTAGESSARGAERELYEELGIKHGFRGVRPHFSFSHKLGFADCYIIEKDVDPASLNLQQTEVSAARYATLDEILDMIEVGEFIPYYESLMRLMFDMRAGYGTHRDMGKKK